MPDARKILLIPLTWSAASKTGPGIAQRYFLADIPLPYIFRAPRGYIRAELIEMQRNVLADIVATIDR